MKKIDSKKFLIAALLIVGLYAAYATGQSRKPVENCCCKHIQRIDENLNWLVTEFKKPGAEYVSPPPYKPHEIQDPGPIKAKQIKVPKSF